MALTQDFAAEARRRKAMDDDQYMQAQQREWQADDTRRASMATLKSVNSGGYPLIGGPSDRLAPASGYMGARDYYQGMDDQQTIATHNGGGVRFGGNVAGTGSRPSMNALRGGDPNDFTSRMQANYDEHAPTGEQARQGRLLHDMDTRTEVGIRGDLSDARENFDINSGQEAARAQGIGDIRRTQSRQDARQGSENYFDPEVSRMREAQFGEEMSRLRARYTDPAITKGINDSNVAMIRGQYGLGRQDLINAGVLDRTAMTDATARRGQDVGANSRVAAASASMGATPGPNRDFSNDGPPPDPGKTITRQELADFARENNMSLTDAMAQARAGRYTIQ